MMVQSPVTIEYDVEGETYTLVDVGGWFAELLKVRGEQDVFERDGYKQEDGWFEAMGGATAVVTFTTVEGFDTLEEAQAGFDAPDVFDGTALMQTTGTLRVIAGDTTAEWESAVLQDVEPTLPDESPDESPAALARAFSFLTPAVPVIS